MPSMTIPEIIDELTYRNYRFNRLQFPQHTPEEWASIFPNVPGMGARFQKELEADKAAETEKPV